MCIRDRLQGVQQAVVVAGMRFAQQLPRGQIATQGARDHEGEAEHPRPRPVSYTHLDVYKRQVLPGNDRLRSNGKVLSPPAPVLPPKPTVTAPAGTQVPTLLSAASLMLGLSLIHI